MTTQTTVTTAATQDAASVRSRNHHGFKRASARPGASNALRLEGVEGWRGIAALLVITIHVWSNMGTDGSGLGPGYSDARVAWFFGNLDIVVDLFFVLSGLLLWLPFARAIFDDDVEVPLAGVFLFRRCLRLLPLYWVLVCVTFFTRNFGVGTADWRDLILHLTLLQSFDSRTIFYDVGPAWSLSVEWIFYLSIAALGPPFVRWVRRDGAARPVRVRRSVLAFLGVITGSLLFKANVAWVWDKPVTDWAWRFGPAAKADTFAIGMLLATSLVLMGGRKLTPWVLPAAFTAAVALYAVVAAPPMSEHNLHFQVVRHTVAALAFALILFAVTTTRWRRVPRMVDNPVLVRISLLAYSIYLVHEPILLVMVHHGWFSFTPSVTAFVVDLVLVLTVVIPAAWVAHRLIEEPWTDLAALRDRRGGRVELYPHLLDLAPPAAVGASAAAGAPLRSRVLARLMPAAPTSPEAVA